FLPSPCIVSQRPAWAPTSAAPQQHHSRTTATAVLSYPRRLQSSVARGFDPEPLSDDPSCT
ncbi:hypothetical protein Bpfe_008634, partial [Biomphalaria pfeifferi]